MSKAIVLGSRGSDLALAQVKLVQRALRVETRVEIIRTSGDERTADRRAGRKGMFTAELERALLEKRVDVAVHSAKDLPSELDSALTIAAVLERGPVEDVLLTKTATPFATLPHGATIATGSVRRQRQAGWLRSDFKLVDLRGNVPTRLRKFAASAWDGIILARAGLERLGFAGESFDVEKHKFFAEILPLEIFVPAGGQGIIALQTGADEVEIVSAIDHLPTRSCLNAEREFLRLLQGDCDSPVGACARLVDGELELRAQFFTEVTAPKMASARGSDPEKLAVEVFEKIHGH
ncbi:MAG: hydroxymethylbilane synthase [Verrucomicrobiota bacterium]|nr:hydroxymethylbilane synthase [Verrucomicrobiota bacterium]